MDDVQWAVIALGAVAAILGVWNAFGRTKQSAEHLLDKYADMLADARRTRRPPPRKSDPAATSADAARPAGGPE